MARNKTVVNNFGGGSIHAPSLRQRDWPAAISAGAVVGALSFLIGLALIWRPMLGIGAPGGALVEHVKSWGASGIHLILPFLFEERASAYSSYLADLSERGGEWLLWGRIALAAMAAGGLSALVFHIEIQPRHTHIHLRGRRLLEGGEAIAQAIRLSQEEIRRSRADLYVQAHPKTKYPIKRYRLSWPPFERHRGIQFSSDRWTKHMLIGGAVGGGKTTILLGVLKQIFDRDERAIIFDIKGDFTAKFPKGALFAPWDKRGLVRDIAKDCSTRQDARELANRLIEDSKDPMWANASRQVLVGFIVKLQQERGTKWGWKDLHDMLSTPEEDLAQIMMEFNPEALRAVEQAGQSQTATSILINMAAFLSIITDLAMAWGDAPPEKRFSFSEWLFNENIKGHRQIILQGNGRFSQLTRGYVSSIIAMLASRINSPEFSDNANRKLWFILDEFPQIGKVDVEPLIAVGRSKGVRVILGYQDLAQIKKIYSAEDAEAFSAMVGTQIYARVSPGETAKKISETIHKAEIERSNISVANSSGGPSKTLMFSREEVSVISEDQLTSELGPGPNGVTCLLIGFEDALMITWPYQNIKNKKGDRLPYVEADWVSGKSAPLKVALQKDPFANRQAEEDEQAERFPAEATPLAAGAQPEKERGAAAWLAAAASAVAPPAYGSAADPYAEEKARVHAKREELQKKARAGNQGAEGGGKPSEAPPPESSPADTVSDAVASHRIGHGIAEAAGLGDEAGAAIGTALEVVNHIDGAAAGRRPKEAPKEAEARRDRELGLERIEKGEETEADTNKRRNWT